MTLNDLKASFFSKLFKGVTVFAVALFILLTLAAPVFAQASSEPILNINLRINASWGGGDIINLDITDLDTGERQQVAIRLSDFIGEGENVPYILLQAMDLLGERQSGVIQIENPLFDPSRPQSGLTVGDSGSAVGADQLPGNLQNIADEANRPPPQTLTPDGTGEVLDNIMTINNIEFFTITTGDGSDFFLVIDRQRTSNNVYLLNTVTEADLMALAEARGENLPPASAGASGGASAGTAQSPEPSPAPSLTAEEILLLIQEATRQEENQGAQTAPPPAQQGSNGGVLLLVFIFLFLVAGGFAAWKFLLPKLQDAGRGGQGDIEDEEEYGDDGEDGDYATGFDNVEVDEDEEYNHEGGYEGTGYGFGDLESGGSEHNRGGADDED